MSEIVKPGGLNLEDPRSVKIWRTALQSDFLRFSRFFFKQRLGYKMMVAPHHIIMAHTLSQVILGRIKRLIINIPPGYTKTEMAVINFIAYGLAVNPKSKFIHVTYSDALALENSTQVRDIIESEEFYRLWNIELRKDTKAKGTWKTHKGGGMQARAAGGPITGFRAGQPPEDENDINPRFSGAFIMDDMIKPDDAYSEPTVEKINKRFTGVFESRLMKKSVTPMILIMQRISSNDPTNHLLTGGTGEKWHHLNLSAITKPGEEYPKEYTHGIPIEHDLPAGPLWEYKHTIEELELLERTDPYTTAAQYYQKPQTLGGGIFKEIWWQYFNLGEIQPEFRIVTVDTAQKIKEHNDYSVMQCWGYLKGNIYLLDQIRGRWEAPQLILKAKEFWNKHRGTGDARTTGKLRAMYIEDKVSGTGLIQELRQTVEPRIPVKAVQRNRDKLTRAMDTVPHIASGHVFLDANAPYLLDFKNEFGKFSADDTHDFDDQVDTTMDAVEILLSPSKKKAGTF